MNLLIPNLVTNKLFFGKFPFKIATTIKGGNLIKLIGMDNVLNYDLLDFSYKFRISSNDTKILKSFAEKLKIFLDQDIQLRFTSSTVNIFVKDETLFLKIIDTLQEYVKCIWKPENNNTMSFMLNNSKYAIVKEYPHKIYTHKVIFKEIPAERRENLLKWLNKYPDEFKISKSTVRYLSGSRFYIQDPFILVKSHKMLTMVSLMSNEYIRRVEKFILKSSINIET